MKATCSKEKSFQVSRPWWTKQAVSKNHLIGFGDCYLARPWCRQGSAQVTWCLGRHQAWQPWPKPEVSGKWMKGGKPSLFYRKKLKARSKSTCHVMIETIFHSIFQQALDIKLYWWSLGISSCLGPLCHAVSKGKDESQSLENLRSKCCCNEYLGFPRARDMTQRHITCTAEPGFGRTSLYLCGMTSLCPGWVTYPGEVCLYTRTWVRPYIGYDAATYPLYIRIPPSHCNLQSWPSFERRFGCTKGMSPPKVDHRSNAGSAVQRVCHPQRLTIVRTQVRPYKGYVTPKGWPSFERRFGRTKGMSPRKVDHRSNAGSAVQRVCHPQRLTIVRTQVRPYKGYVTPKGWPSFERRFGRTKGMSPPKVDHRSNAGSAVQRVCHPERLTIVRTQVRPYMGYDKTSYPLHSMVLPKHL